MIGVRLPWEESYVIAKWPLSGRTWAGVSVASLLVVPAHRLFGTWGAGLSVPVIVAAHVVAERVVGRVEARQAVVAAHGQADPAPGQGLVSVGWEGGPGAAAVAWDDDGAHDGPPVRVRVRVVGEVPGGPAGPVRRAG